MNNKYAVSKEYAFSIDLPKWPQLIITGEKITEELADEVIRRTDSFFSSMWIKDSFDDYAQKITKLPNWNDYEDYHLYDNARKIFKKNWGYVSVDYIHNDWVSSSYVCGCDGWCHPDGTIYYDDNIGKWPTVEEVYNDLVKIADAFPFIKMTATLKNEESDVDGESIISFDIESGKVDLIMPIPYNSIQFMNRNNRKISLNYDHYYKLSKIKEWADRVYNHT